MQSLRVMAWVNYYKSQISNALGTSIHTVKEGDLLL